VTRRKNKATGTPAADPVAASLLLTPGVLAAAFVLGLWPIFPAFTALWTDTDVTTYTHGFLIAAISAWLLWRRRAALVLTPEVPAVRWMSGVLLLGLVLAWQLAWRAGIQVAYLPLPAAIVVASILACFGRRAARAAAFPAAFLLFAVPLWDYLNPGAQWLTVQAVRLMLRVTGIPAHFDDNVVEIPAGTFEIAGGCSGLHFIIVALTIGALLGELRGDSWRGRLRWLAIALLLAVVSNWARVYLIILAGHLTQMQHYIVRVSHYGFGWALFCVALVVLFLLERRAPTAASSAVHDAPDPRTAPPASRLAIVSALLLAPSLMNALILSRVAPDPGPQRAPAGWSAVADGAPGWRPVQPGADLEQRAAYGRANGRVSNYVAWYRDQGGRKKLGAYGAQPAGESRVLDSAIVRVGDQDFVQQHVARDGDEALLFVQYRVGGRGFTSAVRAQLWYSLRALVTLRSASSEVRIARSECVPDCAAARATLESFVNQRPGEGT
jgi:exosortase A